MKITVYFESAGVYATGLSPTLNIRDISDGSLAVTAGEMSEVGTDFISMISLLMIIPKPIQSSVTGQLH